MTKNILITGCSSGIGYAAAKALKARGYHVIATARKDKDVQRLKQEGFSALSLDVNDSDSIAKAVAEVLALTNNRLYALINNAGYGQVGALEDMTRDLMRAQFETNVFGLLELTNAVLPTMRKQGVGRIINISSILGFVAMPFRGAYNASKFAVEGLSDTLRLELKGSQIYVSLIEPGPIVSQFRSTAYASYQEQIDAAASVHKAVYQTMEENFVAKTDKSMFTRGPEAVVKKIIHALESRRPKPRYHVTIPTHMLAFAKRILSARLLDRVLSGL